MRLLLLGPPGGGKGTQGKLLSQRYHVPHIASGVMLREQIANRTEFGRKIEARLAQGRFAPTSDMIAWIQKRISLADAHLGYILDGFPRDIEQARAFDTLGVESALDAVVELQLTDQALTERLKGRWLCPVCERSYHDHYAPPMAAGSCDNDGKKLIRRPDDAASAVSVRMAIYEKVTRPLRSYYEAQALLVTVEASGSIDEVQEAILYQLSSDACGYKNARLEV